MSLEAIRRRFRNDFAYYAPRALKIVNETGQLVPFVLNKAQLLGHGLIEKQLKTKGYVRANVLKPRKLGFSTYTEGRYYWKTSHNTGMGAMIMTEADQSRDSLFRMVKTYHENMPDLLRPETLQSNEKALVFDNARGTGLKSRYDVKTCDSKGGKGITTHFNHWSECAYFSKSSLDNLSGLMESIPSRYPQILKTEVIKESTANGASGHFYDEWTETEDALRDGRVPEYINIFIPWTFDDGYSIPCTVEQEAYILNTLTDEEKWLLRFVNPDGTKVTVGNIAWRRWKIGRIIAPHGYTKEDFFKQWFPVTSEEAFVYSGTSIFSVSDVKMAELECYNPIDRGSFNYFGKFVSNDEGALKIWQRPRLGESYVIGADVAEGIQTEDRDYSSADVINCRTGQQVAHVHCKLDPDRFGEFLNFLGRYYNDALMGVEANNHGWAVLTTLKHKNYRRLYQRETLDANANNRKVKKVGWLTTSKSKYKIIDGLVAIIRDHDSGIVCLETLSEFKDYSILEDGSYGAVPGRHDDRVMSYAIAYEMYIGAPRNRSSQESRQRKGLGGLNLKEAIILNR
ncbi:MAG: hypothetical protein GY718_01930 [Lentisphaerae bacterium]|nr:hypothetical protein [Lentisphaerota bacterium]